MAALGLACGVPERYANVIIYFFRASQRAADEIDLSFDVGG